MRLKNYLIALILTLLSCSEWEYPYDFPIIFTSEVININSSGAELVGFVESIGKQKVINYGFVWSKYDNPTLESSNVICGEKLVKGKFSKVIDSDLELFTPYSVRAFVKTETQVVYGNEIKFRSIGSKLPIITGFEPTSGFDGTIVTIKGQRFSNAVNGNVVSLITRDEFKTFASLPCQIITFSDTLIQFISPTTTIVGDAKIVIEVATRNFVTDNTFKLLGPRISSLSKYSGKIGDLVKVEGEYFASANPLNLALELPWNSIQHTFVSDSKLEFYVPLYYNLFDGFNNPTKNIFITGNTAYGIKKFGLIENFTILNSQTKISNSNPLPGYPGYSSAVLGNSIFIAGGKYLYEYNVESNIWTKKADFPGANRFHGIAFIINGKFYYGFGQGYDEPMIGQRNTEFYNDLWEYDPTLNSWQFVCIAPISKRSKLVSMVINNIAYIGLGQIDIPTQLNFNDFWSFDVSGNTWNEISTPIQNTFSGSTCSFVIGNSGYILTDDGQITSMWQFNSSDKSWSSKANYPDRLQAFSYAYYSNNGSTIFNNNAFIIGKGRLIYEYHVNKNIWIARQNQTQTSQSQPFQFAHYINNLFYLGFGSIYKMDYN